MMHITQMLEGLRIEDMPDKIQSLLQTKEAMIAAWNESNVDVVTSFFSEDAVLYDDDGGQVVSGKNEIKDYLSITFELAETHGTVEIKLNSERMCDDGDIIDYGTYYWHMMHRGRYLQKWQNQSGSWRIVAHYFTIEKDDECFAFRKPGQ